MAGLTIWRNAANEQVSPNVKGQIALIRRGTCTFVIKVNNAQKAGAVGVIVYNNRPGTFGADVSGTSIPVVTISEVHSHWVPRPSAASGVGVSCCRFVHVRLIKILPC